MTVRSTPGRPPKVSVIITNFRLTADCLNALDAVQATAATDGLADDIEIIVVDNESCEESASALRAHPSAPIVLTSDTNLGRAAGNQLGSDAATGRFVAFLNPNAEPEPGWLRAALEAFAIDLSIGCVASLVLDWDRRTIDSAGGGLGLGTVPEPRFRGQPANRPTIDQDVLFAPATSMIVRTAALQTVGGFDATFENAGEDLDLGWRLWASGHRVRFVAASRVRHRQHGILDELGPYHRLQGQYRGALLAIAAVAEDGLVGQFLTPLLAAAIDRGATATDGPAGLFTIDLTTSDRLSNTTSVPTSSAALLDGLSQAMVAMPHAAARRVAIQAQRRRSDTEIFDAVGLQQPPTRSTELDALVSIVGTPPAGAVPRRIAIVTVDVLSDRMAGPAIRAYEMARTLAAQHDVRLVSLQNATLRSEGMRISSAGSHAEMRAIEDWADVLVVQGYVVSQHPFLEHSTKTLVVDLYDPYHFEQLEHQRGKPQWQADREVANSVGTINQQIARGDFFMCASEKQRDLWLGHLGAGGRINPSVYRADESLRQLIDVVPFGLNAAPPQQTAPAMRGVMDGIEDGDRIVLWAGGIYNWFDPLTLIRAIDEVRVSVPNVRLVFMGMQHPNPDVPEMEAAVEAQSLSDALGLTDVHVFFKEGWVPYEQRQDYLVEADLGVSTHLLHLETAFSFRTRLLDYLWAGLPIVSTEGDGFAPLITETGVGRVVPAQDVRALAHAIQDLLSDDNARAQCAAASRLLASSFTWERVLEPLIRFCRHPVRSADAPSLPDRTRFDRLIDEGAGIPPGAVPKSALSRDARTVARAYAEHGISGVADVVRFKLGTMRA